MEWFSRRRKDADVLKIILNAGINEEPAEGSNWRFEKLAKAIEKALPDISIGD